MGKCVFILPGCGECSRSTKGKNKYCWQHSHKRSTCKPESSKKRSVPPKKRAKTVHRTAAVRTEPTTVRKPREPARLPAPKTVAARTVPMPVSRPHETARMPSSEIVAARIEPMPVSQPREIPLDVRPKWAVPIGNKIERKYMQVVKKTMKGCDNITNTCTWPLNYLPDEAGRKTIEGEYQMMREELYRELHNHLAAQRTQYPLIPDPCLTLREFMPSRVWLDTQYRYMETHKNDVIGYGSIWIETSQQWAVRNITFMEGIQLYIEQPTSFRNIIKHDKTLGGLRDPVPLFRQLMLGSEPTDREFFVWRGIRARKDPSKNRQMEDLLNSGAFPGYKDVPLSTSTDSKVALNFTIHEAAMFYIRIPVGTRGVLPIGRHIAFTQFLKPGQKPANIEQEILLPPGTVLNYNVPDVVKCDLITGRDKEGECRVSEILTIPCTPDTNPSN